MKPYIVTEEVDEFEPRTEQRWSEYLYHDFHEVRNADCEICDEKFSQEPADDHDCHRSPEDGCEVCDGK